jgi:hypothetical protein
MKEKKIEIIITQKDVDDYNKRYFDLHPRAKKKRIDGPYHPTLNWYMTANNKSVNNKKQDWKDFILFILRNRNLLDYAIKKCKIEYRTLFEDRHKRDLDNITPKFIFDGLVEGNFIVAERHYPLCRRYYGYTYRKAHKEG